MNRKPDKAHELCVDPIPAEARTILRQIAEELRRTPRLVLSDPTEVAKIIALTAKRIEGVAAISRPERSPRVWRLPASEEACVVTSADGRQIAIEARQRRRKQRGDPRQNMDLKPYSTGRIDS